MSYLNNLLGEIEGSKPTDSSPSAPAPPPRVDQTTMKEATAANGISNGTVLTKRKAAENIENASNKLPRKNNSSPGSSKPSSAAPPSQPPLPGAAKPAPYRGTAGSSATPSTSKPPSNLLLKSAAPSKPNAQPSADSGASAKAPAKGSYAEILARGKASQPKDFMKIKNQKSEPRPVATRRERKLMRRARSRTADREIQSAGESRDSVMGRRRPDEYKGNARASSATPATKSTGPSYSGTARPTESDRPAKKEKVRNAGYVNWGDDDDDEDELEEGEYLSDASSDMEANMFEVDREEAESTRVAKKEDADELAKLNELDRQKNQRRQMLEKMAAEKKNKKRVL